MFTFRIRFFIVAGCSFWCAPLLLLKNECLVREVSYFLFFLFLCWRRSKNNVTLMQRGVHFFFIFATPLRTSSVGFSLMSQTTFPCCVALVFFWRPHPAWESPFSFLQHLSSNKFNSGIICKNQLPMLRGARFFWLPHTAWESIFSLLQHLYGETLNSDIICKNQPPMLCGARFFLRPHPAWESIFSLLQHLCSENDILKATALLMASCTLQSTKGAAESVHDALRSVHDCVESLVDVLFCAVLGNYNDACEAFVNT